MRTKKPGGLASAASPKCRSVARGVFATFAAGALSVPALVLAAPPDRTTSDARRAVAQVCVPDTIALPSPATAPAGPGGMLGVELEGDQVDYQKDELVILRGHAQAKQGKRAVFGDELRYVKKTDEIEATGNVSLYSEWGDHVTTDHLKLQVPTQIGTMDKADFQIADRRRVSRDKSKANVFGRGSSEKARFEGEGVMRLQNAKFTTCVKGQDDVILSASEMVLDRTIGQGEAKNATLRLFGVPVFYFPWVSFPISSERKSGFLYPSFGFKDNSGFMLSVPYYFNIAPNYDATVWGRWFADRGVQAAGEFRYLTEQAEGIASAEFLPSDKVFGDDRYAASWHHEHQFSERWDGLVDAAHVSDSRYLEDFRNNLNLTSTSYIPQLAQARYIGPWWNVTGRVTAYETVDDLVLEENEPYSRLPQLLFRSTFPAGPYQLRYGLDAEAVNFDHEVLVKGARLDATPYAKLPLREPWGFVEPKVSLRLTGYNLDNQAEGSDDSPTRTVPIFSVKSGLFFERETSIADVPFFHTLEPELFYVYVPFENQDDIPNFDTGVVNYTNFSNLFLENRFHGADRVGDNNQVTLALTSRLIDDDGREWLRGRIGQAYFLEDREVTRKPDTVDTTLTDSTTDVLGEVLARITDRWRGRAFLSYDDEDGSIRNARLDAIYHQGTRSFVDLGYYYSRDGQEQLILNGEWPLAARWHLMFSEHYSLDASQNLDTSIGVEYNACCWMARAYAQYRVESDGETRNALIFEFELPGFGRVRSGL